MRPPVLEILTLVAAGPGMCLVPSAVARHYPRSDVADVPVDDAEHAFVSLAWRAGALILPLVACIETVRDVAARTSAEPPAGDQAAYSKAGRPTLRFGGRAGRRWQRAETSSRSSIQVARRKAARRLGGRGPLSASVEDGVISYEGYEAARSGRERCCRRSW